MSLDKVWVFAEAFDGKVKTITLEILAKAREIADTVECFYGGDGDDVADELREQRGLGAGEEVVVVGRLVDVDLVGAERLQGVDRLGRAGAGGDSRRGAERLGQREQLERGLLGGAVDVVDEDQDLSHVLLPSPLR